jgi:ABC-type oligopeptide transport system ATPase subunit
VTDVVVDQDHGLLEAEHLQMYFPVRSGLFIDRKVADVHAVEDVTLTLKKGETLGVVGESGCGKTTLSRCLVRLLTPTGGKLRFDGQDITTRKGKSLRDVRRQVQMVFQDPQSSLNPRQRVGQRTSSPAASASASASPARSRWTRA